MFFCSEPKERKDRKMLPTSSGDQWCCSGGLFNWIVLDWATRVSCMHVDWCLVIPADKTRQIHSVFTAVFFPVLTQIKDNTTNYIVNTLSSNRWIWRIKWQSFDSEDQHLQPIQHITHRVEEQDSESRLALPSERSSCLQQPASSTVLHIQPVLLSGHTR